MWSELRPLFAQTVRTCDSRDAMKACKGDELQDEARLAKIPNEGLQGLI
jgi:hypothetical protein